MKCNRRISANTQLGKWWCVGLLVCWTGCSRSDRPELAVVRGRVTFEGRPVATGVVQFYPAVGRPARGVLQADGTFFLTTFEPGDGAVPGEHVVTIKSTRVRGENYQPTSLPDEMEHFRRADVPKVAVDTAVEWLVPEAYSRPETSSLKATVEKGRENVLRFDLPAAEYPRR